MSTRCPNVLKMIRAVQPRDEECGIEQVAFYDKGVGTGVRRAGSQYRWWHRLSSAQVSIASVNRVLS